jgi:hypothetical protein
LNFKNRPPHIFVVSAKGTPLMTMSATSRGPVFVVGIWRSGTSLLYALLNQHSQIKLMYEGDLPLLWPLFLRGHSSPDWLERWEFWNQALSRHHLDPRQLPRDTPDIRNAFETVYRHYAGCAIWGCKSPNYYDELQKLATAYPGARFIVIWRDIGDVARSVLQAATASRWFARPGTVLRALLGYRELKKQCEALVKAAVPVHQMHYDDLVNNPSDTLERICRFLQISFEPRMTSLDDADRSAIYSAAHHAGVKSKNIQSRRNQPDILPPDLLKKIQRYIRLWEKEYGGEWPICRHSRDDAAGIASPFERVCDRVVYWLLRNFDAVTLFVYCVLPLPWLRWYRSRKPQRQVLGESTVFAANRES